MKKIVATLVFGLMLVDVSVGTPTSAVTSSKLADVCTETNANSTHQGSTVLLLNADIKASSASNIENVFYSLSNESLRHTSDKLANCMHILALELVSRGAGTRRIKQISIDALLKSGQFEKAHQAAIAWNLFSKRDWIKFNTAIPANLEQASYFELSQDGTTAHQKYINLKQGTYVITYFEPGCSFCEKAKIDIGKDAKLSTIFRKNSIWINSPSIGISRQDYLAWMKPNSPTPGRFLIDTTYWPERDILGVPYFFFIKDGVIIASHLGWHKDSKEKISKHLNELGLMPATGQ